MKKYRIIKALVRIIIVLISISLFMSNLINGLSLIIIFVLFALEMDEYNDGRLFK